MIGETARVRQVGATYADVVATLHDRCFEEAWTSATIATLVTSPGAILLIAETPAEPAGFVLVRIAAEDCEILSMGIDPSLRRMGFASNLIETALEKAASTGATRVVLEVAEDNHAALALYLRCGFEQVGFRSGYYARASGGHANARILARATSFSSEIHRLRTSNR